MRKDLEDTSSECLRHSPSPQGEGRGSDSKGRQGKRKDLYGGEIATLRSQ